MNHHTPVPSQTIQVFTFFKTYRYVSYIPLKMTSEGWKSSIDCVNYIKNFHLLVKLVFTLEKLGTVSSISWIKEIGMSWPDQ